MQPTNNLKQQCCSMASVVLPLNFNSLHPSQITFKTSSSRIRNSNCTSLKFNSSKPLPRSTHFLRASEQDSNSQTLQDGEVDNLGVKAALSVLRFYKREISPILPRSCRYVPTCSEYSMEAYKRYGVLKGTTLTVWRLCRCNPLGGSGYDPPRWFGENRPGEELDD